MRIMILLFFLAPFAVTGQTTSVYIKLTDAGNKLINGGSTLKGYEGWIKANSTSASTSGSGKSNTLFSFTMSANSASADIKRAMGNRQALATAEVDALKPMGLGKYSLIYTIKMQQVKVLSYTESLDSNKITIATVSLQATRIGWTYYTQSVTGVTSVSSKYGWDAAKNTEWKDF